VFSPFLITAFNVRVNETFRCMTLPMIVRTTYIKCVQWMNLMLNSINPNNISVIQISAYMIWESLLFLFEVTTTPTFLMTTPTKEEPKQ